MTGWINLSQSLKKYTYTFHEDQKAIPNVSQEFFFARSEKTHLGVRIKRKLEVAVKQEVHGTRKRKWLVWEFDVREIT